MTWDIDCRVSNFGEYKAYRVAARLDDSKHLVIASSSTKKKCQICNVPDHYMRVIIIGCTSSQCQDIAVAAAAMLGVDAPPAQCLYKVRVYHQLFI
jgi:hypothetical protein